MNQANSYLTKLARTLALQKGYHDFRKKNNYKTYKLLMEKFRFELTCFDLRSSAKFESSFK